MSKENIYRNIEEKINTYYLNKYENKFRNKFHIEMPFGLINDPNGLAYYKGYYYIFYQWNPFGCCHKNKHWGLIKTNDFINFTKPSIALKPEEWFDKDGCYSGGALVFNDELNIFYTGNVRGEKGERRSYQCKATYIEDGSFEKKGVLIDKQPEGYTTHFRDPYIYIKDNKYYMVLGVQNNNLKGRALVYKSNDLKEFSLMEELETNLKDFGYMWECPSLFILNSDKVALIFCPQGLKEEEYKYKNLYQSGYIIGNLDLDKLALKNHSEFIEIDRGFDFYAPQVFNHNNQNIMIGWIGMPEKENEYETKDLGWMFSLTMPRVLEFKNNRIYQKPLETMKNLRQEKVLDIYNYKTSKLSIDLKERCIEGILDIDLKDTKEVEIKFIFKEEYISIIYDKEKEILTLDRTNMNLGGKGIRKFPLKTKNNIKINMFLDKASMEIYYEDGLEVTTLVYFTESEDFKIEVLGQKKINKFEIFNLGGITFE